MWMALRVTGSPTASIEGAQPTRIDPGLTGGGAGVNPDPDATISRPAAAVAEGRWIGRWWWDATRRVLAEGADIDIDVAGGRVTARNSDGLLLSADSGELDRASRQGSCVAMSFATGRLICAVLCSEAEAQRFERALTSLSLRPDQAALKGGGARGRQGG